MSDKDNNNITGVTLLRKKLQSKPAKKPALPISALYTYFVISERIKPDDGITVDSNSALKAVYMKNEVIGISTILLNNDIVFI